MEPKEKKAFEPSGLVPRSIVRTFERFRQQLLPGSETAAIREYRISRYQVLVSARCLFTLLIIPIATNWLVSSWLLSPLVEHFWNTQQNEIFLNSYQEERAFAELESFSEKLFFESLLNTTNTINVDFIPSLCNRNPIPYKGKCYDKNFSSASQSLVTNKFTSDSEAELPLPLSRCASMRNKEQNKSSICKIWVAEPTKMNPYPERAFSERTGEGKGSGVEFVQYEKYLPLPNWENKEQLTLSHNSLTQPLLAPYEVQLRLPFWGIPKFSCASSSLLCIPQRDNRSSATLVPWKFHANDANDANFRFARFAYPIPHTLTGYRGKQIENLHGVRGQQLRNSLPLLPLQGFLRTRSKGSGVVSTNSLLTPLPLQGFSLYPERGKRNWGYIEDLLTPYPERDCKASFCMGYAVTVNNGVKGTEAKAPFLLSVPIESTYDNSLKIKEKVQNKVLELAIYYNQQTIISITNIIGDVVSLVTLGCLFIWMKPEITILKSFLIEAIYSLSDTTKSFLLILLTDLLVGFHSPRGWETALELLLKHFGLPENQDFVFLFVATFPVLLDTVFKYWIFRHLNKISPSTVATYHSMIE